jgi:hypothetical protein
VTRPQRGKAKAAIRRCLDEATELDEAKRAAYGAAAEAIIDAMGPVALKRWNENVESITFYADTESVTRFRRALNPGKPVQGGIRGICVRDRFRPNVCRLHLNGGSETGEPFPRTTQDVYAHEFSHAVDVAEREPQRLSSTVEWQVAWRAEGEEIQERLNLPDRGPNEGFGNFAIIAWNYPEDAKRHFPACWAFWKTHSLV